MGRDKKPPEAPPAPTVGGKDGKDGKAGGGGAPGAAAGGGGEGKPKARGHRQKGAGTVIKSRGEIQTAGGITIKEWQRLPMQLLNEFSQRNKRPMPRFDKLSCKVPGRVQFRCVMQDPKRPGSDADVLILPRETFENDVDAKHSVALLALAHFCRDLPLEQKLPEPYRSLWLALPRGGVGSAPPPPPAAAAPPPRASPTSAPASASAPSSASASASSSASASASASSSATAPTPAARPPPAPAAVPPAGAAAADAEEEGGGAERSLTLASKFVTKKDRRRAEEERDLRRRQRENERQAEALTDANRPPVLWLSDELRGVLERTLRAMLAEGEGFGGGAERASSGGDAGDEEAAERRRAAGARVAAQLERLGFEKDAAQRAVAESGGAREGAEADEDGWRERALQWLCLELPEDRLPRGFATLRLGDGSVHLRVSAGAGVEARVLELEQWGVQRADAVAALRGAGDAAQAVWRAWGALQARLDEAWRSALRRSSTRDRLPPDVARPGLPAASAATPRPAAAPDAADAELEALRAMYGDELRVEDEGREDGEDAWRRVTLPLALDGEPCSLTVAYGRTSLYPCACPLVWVAARHLPASTRLALAAAARHWLHSVLAADEWEQLAGGAVYAVVELLQTHSAAIHAAAVADVGRSLLDGASDATAQAQGGAPKTAIDESRADESRADESRADESERRRRRRAGRERSGAAQRLFRARRELPLAVEEAMRRRDGELQARLHQVTDTGGVPARGLPRPLLARREMLLGVRSGLPAAAQRAAVEAAVRDASVTLVAGATGSGKSTQTPQFILEAWERAGRGGHCRIVCTQPRRIAAIGLAMRVAAERGETVGGDGCVGYHVRGDRRASPDANIVFCTTGILLRQLQAGGLDDAVTHVLVDEVHERSLETDLLLAILRALLPHRPDLRVVLLSATMDAAVFERYFRSAGPRVSVAHVSIPGRTFPIRDIFESAALLGPRADPDADPPDVADADADADAAAGDSDESSDSDEDEEEEEEEEIKARRGLPMADRSVVKAKTAKRGGDDVGEEPFRAEDVARVIRARALEPEVRAGGSILVFLPGVPEIARLQQVLQRAAADEDAAGAGGEALQVVPLHGSLSAADQSRVFDAAPRGRTKVVLATNVAETSITIPGVVCVIDTGRVKEVSYDALNHMSRLSERWVSRAAAEQRRGRAGRDAPGVCVRLYSRRLLEAMDAAPLPEMLRSALDDTCLQLVAMGWSSPAELLNQCLDPPSPAAVASALRRLCDMMLCTPAAAPGGPGAAAAPAAGRDVRLALTPLGEQVARLPLDVRLGKALVMATVLRCVDPVLSCVAALAEQSPFRRAPPDRDADVRRARAAVQWGQSDHLTLCRVVDEWRRAGAGARGARRELAERLLLSWDGMERILLRRDEFRDVLVTAGLDAAANDLADNPVAIRAALCAGLWPQVARVVYPRRTFQETAGGAVARAFASRSVRLFVPVGPDDEPGAEGQPTQQHQHVPKCIAGAKAVRAFAHPASSLFHVGDFATPYLMFFEKRATSKTFLQDLSIVPPWALVLFGGALRVDPERGLLHVGSDRLISFRAPTKTAVLVAELRKAIALAVHQGGWTPSQAPVARAVLELLSK